MSWDRDLVAELLINGMPFAVAIKGIVFLGLWLILIRQDASDSLPRWINRFFFMLFLMSLHIAWLAGYLTVSADASDVEGWTEWDLIIGMNVLPLLTAGAGIMVAIRSRQSDTQAATTQSTFSTDVADTIIETHDDVSEVKADVKELRQRMDQ